MNYVCEICNYTVNTISYLCYHKREKHTYSNCIIKPCSLCEKNFHNPVNYTQKKCQECRDLQRSLNTNDLVYGTYVYNNNKRYYVDKGFVTEVCSIYDCNNNKYCDHMKQPMTVCKTTKCSYMYVDNGYTNCNRCRMKNNKAKNILRGKIIQLKKELGGKCIDCNISTLYILEFDHIDSSKKTNQITKMVPKDWPNEVKNIELRCANCHRIKSHNEIIKKYQQLEPSSSRKSKQKLNDYINQIKILIGCCQICGWTIDNQIDLCVVLEFDHFKNNKTKQVSNLGSIKLRLNEIIKCRCICRACHQITTCLQRGGKMLQLQMLKKEYDILYEKYINENDNLLMNKEVYDITKKLYKDKFPEIFE